MCKYSLIKQMRSDGTLKAAIKTGLIPSKVARHAEVYEYYLKIRSTKKEKMTAVSIVSEDKKLCERSIYRIIKDFGC